MKQLLPIFLLLSQSIFSQGFERNISIGDQSLSEWARYVEDYNGHLYIYMTGACLEGADTFACSSIAKYDYEGEQIWSHIIENYRLPLDRSFAIENDTIYTIGKSTTADNENFHNIYSLDLNGEKINEIFLPLDTLNFKDLILHSVKIFDGRLLLAGKGLTPNNNRPGILYGFDKSGSEFYEHQWYPNDDGFDEYTISDLIINPINATLNLVLFEYNSSNSGNLKARRSLYKLDLESGEVDSIYQTNNPKTIKQSHFNRFKFSSDGDIIYWDDDEISLSSGDIHLSKRKLDSNTVLVWDYLLSDDDYSADHDMAKYLAVDLTIGSQDESYISGDKDWFRFADEEWHRSCAFVSKMNKHGEFQWERLITEYSDGSILPNKSQAIFSGVELSDKSFVAVGFTIDYFENQNTTQESWFLKLNEHGCFGDEIDCGYMLFIENSTSTSEPALISKQLLFSPNPSSNLVNVIIPHEETGVLNVLDIFGNLVDSYTISHSSEKFTINVSTLNSGRYILSFTPYQNKNYLYNSLLIVAH